MERKAIPTGFKRKIPSDNTNASADDDKGSVSKISKSLTVVYKEDMEGKKDCSNTEVPLISILQYDKLKSLHKASNHFSNNVMSCLIPAIRSVQSQLENFKDYFATPNPENYFGGFILKEEVDKAFAQEKRALFIATLQQVIIKEEDTSDDCPYLPKDFFKKILLEDADPVLLQEVIKMYNKNHSIHPQVQEEHKASTSSASFEMKTKEANNASDPSMKLKEENDEGLKETRQRVNKEKEKITEIINLVDDDNDIIEISDDDEL